jgi:hypothetical protein
MITISWLNFKDLLIQKNIYPQYIETDEFYFLKAFDSGILLAESSIDKRIQLEDCEDFETNFKDNSNQPIIQDIVVTDGGSVRSDQFDTDGAQIVRIKAAKRGWTYSATACEFVLGLPGSMNALNVDGTQKSWITLKCYNDENELVTDPLLTDTVIRTEIDFEPPYDYEVIGGSLRQSEAPIDNIYFFIQAAPDIPAEYGGSKLMAEALNLRYLAPGNVFQVDGRVSKLLTYNAVTHQGKLRFIFWHTANAGDEIMMTVEYYKQ